MGDEMKGVLKDTMSAYKRCIADLRAKVEMSMQLMSQSG